MGPVVPPYNGQSVAFTMVFESLKNTHNITLLNISNRNSIISSLILFVKIFFTVFTKKTDLIYFTCSRSFRGSFRDIILLYSAKIKKIKVINHLHGSDFMSFYQSLPAYYRKLVYRAYSFIHTSIVLIDGMEEQFDIFPSMKKVVVENCYNNNLDTLPTQKQSHESINILYLSNVMKSKGIIDLLTASKEILNKYDRININIAGDIQGDSYASSNEIETEFYSHLNALQSEFPERVNYLGICKGEEKKELLWKSDIFVLPTYYVTEAFPISILEAMRAGNYIISTNYKYIPKIVLPENGKLVTPLSTREIANAIDSVVNNPMHLLSVQNHNIQWVSNNFTEKRTLDKIKNVLVS